jgi:multicomponent Na+:H+ antiporter subunit B
LKTLALLATLVTGALLLYGTKDFPAWGDPQAPASAYLSPHYIEDAVEETHVPNIVTAILGDYRSFDTMLETVVIYCAGMAVVSVLCRRRDEEE